MLIHLNNKRPFIKSNSKERDSLDCPVNEHGGEVLQLGADAEGVAECAGPCAEYGPALRVDAGEPAELRVRLTRLLRVQVVACLPGTLAPRLSLLLVTVIVLGPRRHPLGRD